ncbi:MAG: radical SAM protein [Candidatus Aenigmarchaeota archaeon]|nr:radical SAM protein [Candidatus Aenigmarchaeota archaeon]
MNKTIKTAIVMGYECNNNCLFCYVGDKKGKYPSMTTQQVKEELLRAKKRGVSFIDFNGGEPTIRKDIFELVSYAKELGFREIAVTSNGRMFYYEWFAKKIIDCGLNHAVISIHGHKPELHDFLTQVSGSFKQATIGLKNLKEINPDMYICINTVITRYNYKYLPEILKFVYKFGVDGIEFIFIHPRGNAWKLFDEIVPTYEEVSKIIPKTVEVGKNLGIKHMFFRYFPICMMIGNYEYLSEFMAIRYLREQHVAPDFVDLEVEKGRKLYGRVKGPQCKACKFNSMCEGIWKEYAEKRGFDELTPY